MIIPRYLRISGSDQNRTQHNTEGLISLIFPQIENPNSFCSLQFRFREEGCVNAIEAQWFSISKPAPTLAITPFSWVSTSTRTRSSSNTASPRIFGNLPSRVSLFISLFFGLLFDVDFAEIWMELISYNQVGLNWSTDVYVLVWCIWKWQRNIACLLLALILIAIVATAILGFLDGAWLCISWEQRLHWKLTQKHLSGGLWRKLVSYLYWLLEFYLPNPYPAMQDSGVSLSWLFRCIKELYISKP